MLGNDKNARALDVYEKMCKVLDAKNWHYERHDEDLAIVFTVTGEDLPMRFLIRVLAERQVISLITSTSVSMPKEKLADGAVAVAVASYGLSGSFDYNLENGAISYRMTESYMDSDISEGVLDYLLHYSIIATDKYNDMFLMLAKDMMTITEFIEKA